MTATDFIDLAMKMNWPFAATVVGTVAAVGVPLMVTAVSRSARRIRELEVKKEVEVAKINTAVKNGSVAVIPQNHG
jgi:hypothetical protein